MRKKIRNLVMLILSLAMMTGNMIHVYAEESNADGVNLIEICVENGEYEFGSEIISDTLEIMPRFPVYREETADLTFQGWITPPSTYHFNAYNKELKTQMSGTLYLQRYDQRYQNLQKITFAVYKGTVSGNI